MVNVNCSAMIFLTAAVVGSMESRKTGLIINIASDFGRLPAPLVSLYGATKAFVIHFSKCIRYEYAPSNIHVQCVCPMFVCTKMSGMKRSSFLIPMPEKFVQHALCSATRLKVSFRPHSMNGCVFPMVIRPAFQSMTIFTTHPSLYGPYNEKI